MNGVARGMSTDGWMDGCWFTCCPKEEETVDAHMAPPGRCSPIVPALDIQGSHTVHGMAGKRLKLVCLGNCCFRRPSKQSTTKLVVLAAWHAHVCGVSYLT